MIGALPTPCFTGAARQFFGDIFAEPVAHYGLQDRYSHNQTCVRVRRSSDNAEANFGTQDVINGSLVSWVGANDGHVVTWFDLTSSGNNATQATAGSQPKIVASGSLVQMGDFPAIDFDGTDDVLEAPDDADFDFSSDMLVLAAAQAQAEISSGVRSIVCKYNSGNNEREWLLGIDSSNDGIALYVGKTGGSAFETVIADSSTDETQAQAIGAQFDSGTVTLYKDSGLVASTASGSLPSSIVNDVSPLIIGAAASGAGYSATGYWNGLISEIVIYGSDQSSNRTAISDHILLAQGI